VFPTEKTAASRGGCATKRAVTAGPSILLTWRRRTADRQRGGPGPPSVWPQGSHYL